MGFKSKANADLSRRYIILEHIKFTNRLISGFNATPETINATAGLYDSKSAAQEGKKIALAILTLRLNVTDILPPLFYQRSKEMEETLFAKKTYTFEGKPKKGFIYLAEDQEIQFEGVLELMNYYGEILNALYSLPDFRDIKYDYGKEDLEQPHFEEAKV